MSWLPSLLAVASDIFLSFSLTFLFTQLLAGVPLVVGRKAGVCVGEVGSKGHSPGGGRKAWPASTYLVYFLRQVANMSKRRCKHDARACPHTRTLHILSRSLNTQFFQALCSPHPPLPEESLSPNFIILVPIKFFSFLPN